MASYSPYGSFASLLASAKRQSELRGTPLSSSEINSLGSGYFSDALDAANTERSYDLAESSQSLAEQTQAAQENQFAQTLAQSKASTEAQQEAAKKAEMQSYASTGGQAALGGAWLYNQYGNTAADTVGGITANEAAGMANAAANSAAASGAITGDAAVAATETGALATPATAQLTGTGAAGGTAATSGTTAATPGLLSYTGPAAGGLLTGSLVKSTGLGEWASNNMPFGGTNEWNTAGGAAGGAAIGAGIGSIVPGVGTLVGGAIGAVAGAIGGGTWLCTEISKYIGLSDDDNTALSKLRRYSIKHHKEWLKAYRRSGKELVEAINAEEVPGIFYQTLKDAMVVPVIDLVRAGKMEEAFTKYKDDTLTLANKYAPEILTEVS